MPTIDIELWKVGYNEQSERYRGYFLVPGKDETETCQATHCHDTPSAEIFTALLEGDGAGRGWHKGVNAIIVIKEKGLNL